MREITLTRGAVAIVDDADYGWLSTWKWRAARQGEGWRAVRSVRAGEGKRGGTILMHREILGLAKEDASQCDHINHNPLDNRRANLRRCSGRENKQNQQPKKGTSRFKGVSWCNRDSKWAVYIREPNPGKSGIGRRINLGLYHNERRAAEAYDYAALRLFGEFACLNYPEPHCGLKP